MKDLLIKLDACQDARDWAKDKNWKEIFETCHRGDWLLWLFKKTNKGNLKLFTLAKGHCANTVRHLMKDERSTKAVDAAIAFGNGEIDSNELAAAAATATYATDAATYVDAATYAAATAATYAATDATDATTYATDAATYAAAAATYAADAATYAATDAAAAAAATYAARKNNQQLTADICRKYLPIEVWNISELGELINN